MLDSNCEPKIGDFGFSLEGQNREEVECLSKAFGTKPYMAPEFMRKKLLSTKIDVFSFGVVLLELATGFSVYDKQKKTMLYDYMASIDLSSNDAVLTVMDNAPETDHVCVDLCKLFIKLGRECTKYDPDLRPDMLEVYEALDKWTWK